MAEISQSFLFLKTEKGNLIMPNVENLEKKLEQLIITNDKPLAIALTGEWGIGKTHFWNDFFEKNKSSFDNRKYAYVSLFGIESLESLKLSIATETHTVNINDDSILHKDILQPLKKITTSLSGASSTSGSDVKVGINISNQLITNLVLKHLDNALIVLDDFERKSNKLSLSDILGLANYLKVERNCQVILMLDDNNFKVEDEKLEFRKYKEKVFDDVLVLDDNLDILKNFIDDNIALEMMEKFYHSIKVKNLRFYLKVYKNYKEIIYNINNLSELTKSTIILQLLIIKWIDEINPKIPLNRNDNIENFNIDLDFLVKNFHFDDENAFFTKSDSQYQEIQEKREAFWKYIRNFCTNYSLNGWGIELIKSLNSHEISQENLIRLAHSDSLSESKANNEKLRQDLMSEYHSLQPKEDFIKRFYDMTLTQIYDDNLLNLSFYYDVLNAHPNKSYATSFREKVESYISESVKNSTKKPSLTDWYFEIPRDSHIFKEFLLKCIDSYQENISKTDSLIEIFGNYYEHRGWQNDSDKEIVENMDKSQFISVLWAKIDNERYRKNYIKRVLECVETTNLDREVVREWAVELLKEKILENPESSIPIKMWLEQTNELRNF